MFYLIRGPIFLKLLLHLKVGFNNSAKGTRLVWVQKLYRLIMRVLVPTF